MFEVDNQIALGEFAEIDLGAMTFGAPKPQKPSGMNCESSEQFSSRQHHEVCRRETKSPRKRALDKIDPFHCSRHDFAEPLDLTFSLKVNDDSGIVRAPFLQALDELRAFCLGKHEIASAKLSNIAVLKRAAEILRAALNPAFADLDVWRGELLRARRRWRCAFHNWLDIDDEIDIADVIANGPALIRCSLVQQNVDRAQIAHGGLRVDIELAQRFDLVAEKFQAEWQRRLPRINIDIPAADGELSTRGDLRDTLVTAGRESFEKLFHLRGCSALELNNRRF